MQDQNRHWGGARGTRIVGHRAYWSDLKPLELNTNDYGRTESALLTSATSDIYSHLTPGLHYRPSFTAEAANFEDRSESPSHLSFRTTTGKTRSKHTIPIRSHLTNWLPHEIQRFVFSVPSFHRNQKLNSSHNTQIRNKRDAIQHHKYHKQLQEHHPILGKRQREQACLHYKLCTTELVMSAWDFSTRLWQDNRQCEAQIHWRT